MSIDWCKDINKGRPIDGEKNKPKNDFSKEDLQAARIAIDRLFDYYKHMTTLSMGMLIFIGTLGAVVFEQKMGIETLYVLGLTASMFVITVLASSNAMMDIANSRLPGKFTKGMSYVSFLFGTIGVATLAANAWLVG